MAKMNQTELMAFINTNSTFQEAHYNEAERSRAQAIAAQIASACPANINKAINELTHTVKEYNLVRKYLATMGIR